MIVWNQGDRTRESHMLFVCPVADEGIRKEDAPSDWLEADGKGRTFQIDFVKGRAEVESNLGEYLCRRGLASRTSLLGFT